MKRLIDEIESYFEGEEVSLAAEALIFTAINKLFLNERKIKKEGYSEAAREYVKKVMKKEKTLDFENYLSPEAKENDSLSVLISKATVLTSQKGTVEQLRKYDKASLKAEEVRSYIDSLQEQYDLISPLCNDRKEFEKFVEKSAKGGDKELITEKLSSYCNKVENSYLSALQSYTYCRTNMEINDVWLNNSEIV